MRTSSGRRAGRVVRTAVNIQSEIRFMTRYLLRGSALGLAALALACGGGEQSPPADSATNGAAAEAAPAAPSEQTPDAGGKVDSIAMITDATGNYFKPKELTVHQGDVLRFVLGVGVHNATFLADSNPGATGLPAAGPLLQLPGQTYDVKVTFKPGHYYFQCDAHAALGMRGHVTVEAKP
jgi:plastocyanin